MLGVADIRDSYSSLSLLVFSGLSTNGIAVTITYVKLGIERLSVNALFRPLAVATVVW